MGPTFSGYRQKDYQNKYSRNPDVQKEVKSYETISAKVLYKRYNYQQTMKESDFLDWKRFVVNHSFVYKDNKPKKCAKCKGKGGQYTTVASSSTCRSCGGNGWKKGRYDGFPCIDCNGQGTTGHSDTVKSSNCDKCRGTGYVPNDVRFWVNSRVKHKMTEETMRRVLIEVAPEVLEWHATAACIFTPIYKSRYRTYYDKKLSGRSDRFESEEARNQWVKIKVRTATHRARLKSERVIEARAVYT